MADKSRSVQMNELHSMYYRREPANNNCVRCVALSDAGCVAPKICIFSFSIGHSRTYCILEDLVCKRRYIEWR